MHTTANLPLRRGTQMVNRRISRTHSYDGASLPPIPPPIPHPHPSIFLKLCEHIGVYINNINFSRHAHSGKERSKTCFKYWLCIVSPPYLPPPFSPTKFLLSLAHITLFLSVLNYFNFSSFSGKTSSSVTKYNNIHILFSHQSSVTLN